jgi:hypothetical protein
MYVMLACEARLGALDVKMEGADRRMEADATLGVLDGSCLLYITQITRTRGMTSP